MMHKCPLRCSLIQPIPMRSLPSWLRMNVKTLRSLLDQESAIQNDLNQAACSSCPLPKKIWKHIWFLHLKRLLLSLQEVHDLFLLFQKFYVKLGLSLSLLLLSTLLLRVPRPYTVPPNHHQLFPHLFLKQQQGPRRTFLTSSLTNQTSLGAPLHQLSSQILVQRPPWQWTYLHPHPL